MNLRHIEYMIQVICSEYDYDSKDIEDNVQYMTEEDQVKLINLLEIKLKLQKELYTKQGGNLDNVRFLSEYR